MIVYKKGFRIISSKDCPERSLFMIDPVMKEENMWLRQGDKVGHLTIHEVKDGSIVLYKDNALYKEIAVQGEGAVRSLLRPKK